MKRLLVCLIAFWSCEIAMHAQEPSLGSSAVQPDTSEIPKGYEAGEESVSPDGRFAILFPVRGEDNIEPTLPNVLVRLKPYAVLAEIGDEPHWRGMRGEPAAKWNGNNFVAIWAKMKWGNEDLVVYEIANDKVKREQKIWPEVVKYFDRDFHRRFLKKYPKEYDSYTFVADDPDVKNFEFKEHKLLLHILADNKPNLAGGPHWTARLRGTWDIDKAKFGNVEFQPGKISVRPDL